MRALQQLVAHLSQDIACLVEVESTQGSVPRERGAWMAVLAPRAAAPDADFGLNAPSTAIGTIGTIGGGQLEWLAIQRAHQLLAQAQSSAPNRTPVQERYPLGPRLGQCCGGVVQLRFRLVTTADTAQLLTQLAEPLTPIAVFGAGHVGAALVAVLAPQRSSLLGLVSVVAPVIVSGNTAVVLTSEDRPLPAITLAECLTTSDVPGGVVNLVTGRTGEMAPWLASHRDVNAIDLTGAAGAEGVEWGALEAAAAENLKRVLRPGGAGAEAVEPDFSATPDLSRLTAFLETKTVWHPKGR